MDPITILALINGAAQIAKAIGPLIADAPGVMTSEDEAKVKAALADLQLANDALFERVQAKLRG